MSVCGGFVLMVAVCGRPSAETIVSPTGMSAGALTTGGLPRSPAWMVKVAGMRDPLAAAVGVVAAVGVAPVRVVAGGWVIVAGSGPVPVVKPGGVVRVLVAGRAAWGVEAGCAEPPQPASTAPASSAALKALYLVVDNPDKRSGCQMQSHVAHRSTPRRKPFEYDALRHRLWICGQRCHHGAAGTIAAVFACVGLIAEPSHAVRPAVVALTAGGALMLHDWKDRSIWFERGHGSQP